MQNTTMKIIFNNRREKSITVRVSNMAIPVGESVPLDGFAKSENCRGRLRHFCTMRAVKLAKY